jgi:hypothetical protein
MAQSESDKPDVLPKVTLREFFEKVPPGAWRQTSALCRITPNFQDALIIPEILVHCPNNNCNGFRTFRSDDSVPVHKANEIKKAFLTYTCSNCRKETKSFAVAVIKEEAPADTAPRSSEVASTAGKAPLKILKVIKTVGGQIYKYGEEPPFGPPTPARQIKLFGEDKDLFFKGRRCESQGLGIGASVYYRRIVESHKKQIFEEIIKVSEIVGLPSEQIQRLRRASEETQFTRAVEEGKDVIPQTLLIKGHNPLVLLHSALSTHLHEKSDEECLAIAQDVRIILIELADKLAAALKDNSEINDAVTRLMKSNPQ